MNEKEALRYQVRIPLLQYRGGQASGCSIYDRQIMIRATEERRKTMHTKISAKSVSVIGVLVAMEMILSRFLSIHTWNLKIGFNFVPIALAGIFYGPVAAGLVAAIGDAFGALLFPVGPYFPGFTLTAFLTGVVFGLFLKKNQSVKNIVCSVLIVQLIISQCINTYWISFLYGSSYMMLFATRIYQTIAMSVVQIVCILLVTKKLVPALRRNENY